VRTELLYTLGNVLRNMQDVQHSEALLRDAEKTAASLPDNDPVRLETEVGLIRTLIRRGDYDGASARITPLLAIPPRRLPEDAPRAMLLKIAMVIADGRADMQQAVAHGRKMIAAYRADCVAGKHCRDLAFAANDFASILLDADHIAEARPIADEALERKQHENVSLLSLANTVELQSKIALYRGDFAIAEAKARKSDALVASLGNSLAHKPLEPVAQLVEVLLAKGDAASAKNTLDGLMAEQRARKASACTLAWSEMDLSRAQLLLGLPGDAADSGAKAVADGGQCRRAIVRDVTVVLAELAHARALAALGDIDAAAADYARTTAMDATLHHDDPLSWPLYLVQSMRLAETLGRGDDAARFAHALTGALDRADALPTHPWRIEAARVADGAHKVPTGT
jgi:tetratricopeptide (TPR) repeat protein